MEARNLYLRLTRAFLTRAMEYTRVTPDTVTTDKAPIYPPALAADPVVVDHITGTMEQQGIERDHPHLNGRIYRMRGFQTLSSVQVVGAGHALSRNLDHGF